MILLLIYYRSHISYRVNPLFGGRKKTPTRYRSDRFCQVAPLIEQISISSTNNWFPSRSVVLYKIIISSLIITSDDNKPELEDRIHMNVVRVQQISKKNMQVLDKKKISDFNA